MPGGQQPPAGYGPPQGQGYAPPGQVMPPTSQVISTTRLNWSPTPASTDIVADFCKPYFCLVSSF